MELKIVLHYAMACLKYLDKFKIISYYIFVPRTYLCCSIGGGIDSTIIYNNIIDININYYNN